MVCSSFDLSRGTLCAILTQLMDQCFSRGVEFLLGWRQHFGTKIQLGTAHIVMIDSKSPTCISNLEHTIINFTSLRENHVVGYKGMGAT